MNVSTAINAIRDSVIAARKAEAEMPSLVAQARAAGASWQQIGDALGISRQAAHERFNKEKP